MIHTVMHTSIQVLSAPHACVHAALSVLMVKRKNGEDSGGANQRAAKRAIAEEVVSIALPQCAIALYLVRDRLRMLYTLFV